MAVTATNRLNDSYGNFSGTTSFVSTSFTPGTNKLLLAAVGNRSASDCTPTLSGCGLTWVQVNTVASGSLTERFTLFRAMGSSPTTGSLTVSCGGVTNTAIILVVDEFSGMLTTGTNGSGAVVQAVTEPKGANVTTLTATLSTFTSAANATYGAFKTEQAQAPSDWTAGSGFTKIGGVGTSAPNHSVITEFKNEPDTTVDASVGTGSNIYGVAVEIAAVQPTPWTFVQKKFATGTSSSPAVTLDVAPTDGNLVVAILRTDSFAVTTDPSGYTLRATKVLSGVNGALNLVSKVASSTSATITWATPSSAFFEIEAYEFAGNAGSGGEFDTSVVGATNGATNGVTGSLTPAVTGELLIAAAWVGGDDGGSESIDSGFTIIDASSATQLVTGYKVKSNTTAENPDLAWTTNRTSVALMAAFKPRVVATQTATDSAPATDAATSALWEKPVVTATLVNEFAYNGAKSSYTTSDVCHTNLTIEGFSADQSSYVTTASVLPQDPTKYLTLVTVEGAHASDSPTPTITGCGITWTLVTTAVSNAAFRRLSMFRAVSGTPTSGQITATFSTTQIGCSISVDQFTNVDMTASASAAVAQAVALSDDSGLGVNGSATLGNALINSNSVMFSAFVNYTGTAITQSSGYTDYVNVNHASPTTNLLVEAKPNVTSSLVSSNDSNPSRWFTIGVEIAAAKTFTPSANKLQLLFIGCLNDTYPNSVTGCGLTWVKINSTGFAGWQTVVYRAMGASPTAGALTFGSMISGNSNGIIAQLVEFGRVVTTGSNGADAVVQYNYNGFSSGTDTSPQSVTLSTFASGSNATEGMWYMQNRTLSPGSGFTQMEQNRHHDDNPIFQRMMLTEFKNTNDTSVDVSWTGGGTTGIGWGFELAIPPTLASDSAPATDTATSGTVLKNVIDSFDRANSSSTLGSTDSGHTWTAVSGTWGIASNQAKVATDSGSYDIAVVETGKPDSAAQVTIAALGTISSTAGLIFRYVNSTDHWRFVTPNGGSSCFLEYSDVNGAVAVYSGGPAVVNGDVLKVVTSGSTIKLYKNSTLITTVTDSRFSTATKCGMYATSDVSWRFDDFSVAAALFNTAADSAPATDAATRHFPVSSRTASDSAPAADAVVVLPPPANDAFAAAIDLGSVLTGRVTGSTVRATSEAGEPGPSASGNGAHRTIWYKWTAPADSTSATFDTFGSLTGSSGVLDTTLGIFTGSAVNALTEVASNDDSHVSPMGLNSRVTFTPVAGTVYYIQLGGYDDGDTGSTILNWVATVTVRVTTPPLFGALPI